MKFSGLDLNLQPAFCEPSGNPFAGGVDARGQTGVRADHWTSAADDVSPLRGPLRRGATRSKASPVSISMFAWRFAQLTYRESLRDIEACLRAQHSKL